MHPWGVGFKFKESNSIKIKKKIYLDHSMVPLMWQEAILRKQIYSKISWDSPFKLYYFHMRMHSVDISLIIVSQYMKERCHDLYNNCFCVFAFGNEKKRFHCTVFACGNFKKFNFPTTHTSNRIFVYKALFSAKYLKT